MAWAGEMTETHRVGLIVGSASTHSLNRRLADAVVRLGPEVGLVFDDIPISHLPFYGTQYDEDYPDEGRVLKGAIERADGLLIVTPEYNRSIAAVLKNAIDWATRPQGESALGGTPAAIMGATTGAVSTAVAQAHLASLLLAQGMPLLPTEAYIQVDDGFFTDDGAFAADDTRAFVREFLEGLHDLIGRYRD